jgi:lipopolysaccharide transport system ATP-binding protein
MKPIIRVENLSKQYRIGARQASYATLRETLSGAIRAPLKRLRGNGRSQDSTIWALKDVSFEVMPGEVIGIIGRNGAGKSTLLKILSRITEPTSGAVDLYGRVGSLLEVGTGFHAELTGRENIYLNGAILGMKRSEIARRFDEIVAFAEVDRFIDTPVKHYSSGMYLRLAFAVAAHLEPEILVVDEVLAVGDPGFQKKCLGRMDKIAKQGRTVLFVSHQLGAINSLCARAISLSSGGITQIGPTSDVIRNYLDSLDGMDEGSASEMSFAHEPERVAQLLNVRLTDEKGGPKKRFDLFDPVCVEIEYVVRKSTPGLVLESYFYHQGECLFVTFDTDSSMDSARLREAGTYKARYQVPSPLLRAGQYELLCGIGVLNIGPIHHARQRMPFQIVEESVDTSMLSYSDKRIGKLVVPIEWETQQVG